MALYRKSKTIPYKAANPDAVKDIPFVSTTVYPELEIEFINAHVDNPYERNILQALLNIDSSLGFKIENTNLPSIADHKGSLASTKVIYAPVPIFVGSPEDPTEEFLYFNPEIRQNKPSFFSELKADCETSFLFAEVKAILSHNRGITRPFISTTIVPYGVDRERDNPANFTQTIFIDQRNVDVEIRAFDLNIIKLGSGIPVVSDRPILKDTWFDGSWETFSTGGVGIGYTNAPDKAGNKFLVGDRYDWTFGSIYLVRSFGGSDKISPDFGLREINYEYNQDSVKLIGWKYELASDSNYGESLVNGHTMTPINSGKIYGRQLHTYFVKSFQEGRCITIRNTNGGIELGVNFFYNGNCCECEDPSSVSDSSDSSSGNDTSDSSSSNSSHSSESSSSSSSSSISSSSSSSSSSSTSSSSNSSSSSNQISQSSASSDSSDSSSSNSSSSL